MPETIRLTRNQSRLLSLLRSDPDKRWTGGMIARNMCDVFRHSAGARKTAESLVHRGLAERIIRGDGIILYRAVGR